MRKLVTVRQISEILPIEGADNLQLAKIGGWNVVVPVAENYSPGDPVFYFEVDSFLPIEPEFEFLRKSSYRKMGDIEGFRIKTIKLRGQLSQGLVMPLHVVREIIARKNSDFSKIFLDIVSNPDGVDFSDAVGVVKWDPPVPASLEGIVAGNFPSFIQKTDETRIQNLTEEWSELQNSGKRFYVTEKLDGSSATYYLNDGKFGVCSRNLELLESEKNTFWAVARQLKVEEKLRVLGKNIAIQGELIGEGIQKNLYKLKGHDVRFFNVFLIDEYRKASFEEFTQIMDKLELKTVPILETDAILDMSVDVLLDKADNKSELNLNQMREGIVVRSMDSDVSFKVISNKFLLKYD